MHFRARHAIPLGVNGTLNEAFAAGLSLLLPVGLSFPSRS